MTFDCMASCSSCTLIICFIWDVGGWGVGVGRKIGIMEAGRVEKARARTFKKRNNSGVMGVLEIYTCGY